MRLLAGVLAGAPFRSVLVGDESLSRRPMERIAEPLRAFGAEVTTTDGRPPVSIRGGALRGLRYELEVASAQVKGAVLLAALAAEGETTVIEPVATRDHTERALDALGGELEVHGGEILVRPFQHAGFEGTVPGDPSSAAFLLAAAALTSSGLHIRAVGLNPSRLGFLAVMRRMGLEISVRLTGDEVGEPVGDVEIAPRAAAMLPVHVDPDELPAVIDEVPVLAALAAHASGPSSFAGAGELRVKESDRLDGLAAGLRQLGHHAGVEGNDLVLAGGGLDGGTVASGGDHRMAMAFAIAGLAAEGPVVVEGMEAESVSFPGFTATLADLGAAIEVLP